MHNQHFTNLSVTSITALHQSVSTGIHLAETQRAGTLTCLAVAPLPFPSWRFPLLSLPSIPSCTHPHLSKSFVHSFIHSFQMLTCTLRLNLGLTWLASHAASSGRFVLRLLEL